MAAIAESQWSAAGEDVEPEVDEVKLLEEAFAALSMEELEIMAGRLTKCHAGFDEMLQEAESEREWLQRESAHLDKSIEQAMQEIHHKEQNTQRQRAKALARKAEAAIAPVALQVGSAWKNLNQQVGGLNQQVWGNIRQQVTQNTKQVAHSGAFSLLNVRALLNTDTAADRAKQKQAARAERQAARKRARDEQRAQAEAEAAEAEAIALDDKAEKKRAPPRAAATAPPVIVAREPPTVVKRKAVVVVAETVVIEAKITVADGTVHTLNVLMTDTCAEAARKFIIEHSQRQWFEKPLTAWLRKAEAEAVKLPSRIESSLTDLRKQFKDGKPPAE